VKRRAFLTAAGALAVSACATPPLGAFLAAEVPAPAWRAGDRWTYRRTDGYNGLARGILTRIVESADAGGLRFVTRDETGIVLDDARFGSPGLQVAGTLSEDGPVRGAFTPPLRMYDFPLVSGKHWRQSLVRTDAWGFRTFMRASVRVEGWEDRRVGDGTYRSIAIRRNLVLGPKDEFSGTLYREELEWYAPELRGAAHKRTDEMIDAEDEMFGWLPGDRFVYALESFRLD